MIANPLPSNKAFNRSNLVVFYVGQPDHQSIMADADLHNVAEYNNTSKYNPATSPISLTKQNHTTSQTHMKEIK